MMFQFNPVGLLALIAFAMCMSLAVVIFRAGIPGSTARRLSLLLVIEGLTLISTGFIDLFLGSEIRALPHYTTWVRFEEIVHTAGDCAMLALYPPFLAAALPTPLTRYFAGKRVRIGLLVAVSALFFAVFLTPLELGATTLYLLLVVLFLYALVASVHAWHISDGAARSRARSFTIAFGFRDVCWGFVYGAAIWMIFSQKYAVVDTDASGLPYIMYALGTLIAVPLIAYGILRTQLFDIDLRIRWTIKQSTLAAAIISVIFVVTEAAERFLSAELGSLAGLFAAALVVFFLAPLQRFAESVASVTMPHTKKTPEYVAFRKMQVYEAAVVEAMQDEGISHKERALLTRLRDSLDISEADAEEIERELGTATVNDG
jgi:hypothetical protein